jgi:FlaA1/EpsC-like NDP-sugar epimerase
MADQKQTNISYERITGRAPRTIAFSNLELEALAGRKILITGAGGSIGSRITKVISNIPGVDFLATDRDESALHSLSLELSSRALFDSPTIELLDIKDRDGVNLAINRYKPDVIIHAAALKHLSALERQPREALLTNVIGTANLVRSAFENQTPYFVNISTDKAADATSVLGKSKRLGEYLITYFRKSKGMHNWTSCRFGNVYNSRGSVIETFISQMRNGSPITLTDENVTRYFMHPDEAAYLTLKSLLINAGDIHIFDMGEPILIREIIDNLAREIGSTSPIITTGLRPGEKLTEDLYSHLDTIHSVVAEGITVSHIEISPEEQCLIDWIESDNLNELMSFLRN